VIKDIIWDYDKNDSYYDTMTSISSGPARHSEDDSYNNSEIIKNKIMNNEMPIMVDDIFTRHYYNNVISNPSNYTSFISAYDENGEFNPDPREWYTT
jgi:hypothetical protein